MLWLALLNRLHTQVFRNRVSLARDDTCTVCHLVPESVLHILRDCGSAREVWLSLVLAPQVDFYTCDFET